MAKVYVSCDSDGRHWALGLRVALQGRVSELVTEDASVAGPSRKAKLAGCHAMLALCTREYVRSVFDRESIAHKEVGGGPCVKSDRVKMKQDIVMGSHLDLLRGIRLVSPLS